MGWDQKQLAETWHGRLELDHCSDQQPLAHTPATEGQQQASEYLKIVFWHIFSSPPP